MAAAKRRRATGYRPRLTSKNSVFWAKLVAGSVEIDFYLVDRPALGLMKYEGLLLKTECLALIGWDLSETYAEQILVHELKHAHRHLLGLELEEVDEEETHVNREAAAEYDTLKRNGLLRFPPRPAIPGAR
jgi:hypothetical protein